MKLPQQRELRTSLARGLPRDLLCLRASALGHRRTSHPSTHYGVLQVACSFPPKHALRYFIAVCHDFGLKAGVDAPIKGLCSALLDDL